MTQLAAPVEPAQRTDWLPLYALLAGTFLIVLDFFIVNVALPELQTDLNAGAAALEWVVAGYGLTFAVLLIAAGRLGDHIGRRRTFGLGVAVFTVASAACGLAPNAETLVVARLAQGAGAALIHPTVLALIGVLYAGADRARAIGRYATTMGVAAAGGQLIGGVLLRADLAGLGWRLVFLINLPVGVLTLAVLRRTVPESRAERPGAVDVPSLLLAGLALTAVVLPLLDGRAQGWPLWSFLSLAATVPLVVAFLLRERSVARRGGAPLADPALFRRPAFRLGMITQLGFWIGQASYFLVLALYLQGGRGLGALAAGGVFSILAGAYLVASLKAPALAARHGRATLVTGALALAAGHLCLLAVTGTAGADAPLALLVPGLLLAGAGMGLYIGPMTGLILAGVEPRHAGAASGLLATVQQLGNSVGVGVIGVVFFETLDGGYDRAMTLSLGVLALLLTAVGSSARMLPASAR